jgi:hypothetical protein
VGKKKTSEPFHEHTALARVRVRCALGVWAVGVVAGLFHGGHGETNLPVYLHPIIGLGYVTVAMALGGAVGLLGRSILLFFTTKEFSAAEDTVGGITLGAFIGSFLGLIITLIAADWGDADRGAALGACVGAFAGAMFGKVAALLLLMLAHDQKEDEPVSEKKKEED